MRPALFPTLAAALLAATLLSPAPAEILYQTDFEEFPYDDILESGPWAGHEGWVSNDDDSDYNPNFDPGPSPSHGIDQDIVPDGGLGRTAFIGFNRPEGTFTRIFRNIPHDPAAGESLIEFQTLFGIEDSTIETNLRRDDFFFSFYNPAGEFLAAIRLSNNDFDLGIWRRSGFLEDGGTDTDTGISFVRGELHNLNARIDLATNRWSATLDGIPLFTDAPFNTTGKSVSLGYLSVEWELGGLTRNAHGDNWMLVADLRVETVVAEAPPVTLGDVEKQADGSIRISWVGTPDSGYLVEYSPDLERWFSDLPGSAIPAPATESVLNFVDPTAALPPRRYYRVRRTP